MKNINIKKIIVIGIIVLLLITSIIIIAIRHKTVVCTKLEKTTGMNIEYKYTNYFVSNKLNTVKYEMSLKLNSNYQKYKKTIKNSIEEQYKKYQKYKGVTYDIIDNNEIITLNMNIDTKKLKKSEKRDLKIEDETINKRKSTLIKEGYSCK